MRFSRIQGLKKQMCFEQKSTRDPKVMCSTRIISKSNCSRLDMHREGKNCDLSVENVAVQRQFKRNEIGYSNSSSYIRHLYDVPLSSGNIVIPSNGSNYLFKKAMAIPPFERFAGAIREKTIAKFSNCSSPKSVDKTQKFFVQEKNILSVVRASASRSKNIIQPSA